MIKAVIMVLLLLFMLSGCSIDEAGKIDSLPDLISLEKVETTVKQPTFKVLSADYVSAIDKWITAADVESLYTCKYVESDSGTYMMYLFTPSRGLDLSIYTPVNNNEITQLVWRIDTDAAEDNPIEAFGEIIKATVYALDYDNAEAILAELEYENISENAKTTIDCNYAGYVYTVEDNIRQLFIMAKGVN